MFLDADTHHSVRGYTEQGTPMVIAGGEHYRVGAHVNVERRYRRLADDYFDTERYHEFCATALSHVDDLVRDWVASPAFDELLVSTVRSTYPVSEHDRFVAHFRGLLGLWVKDNAGT